MAECIKGQSKKADYRSRKKGQFPKMSGPKRPIMRKDHFLARQYEVQESLCVTPGVGVGGGVDT